MGFIVNTLAKRIEKTTERRSELLKPLLAAQEQLIGFQEGETQAPFLVQMIPFLGDLFGKASHFLIAVTNARLLIVQLSRKAFGGEESIKEVTASIPLDRVENIVIHKGTLTSASTIQTKEGKDFYFKNMLRSAPAALCDDLATAREERITLAPNELAKATAPKREPGIGLWWRIPLASFGILFLIGWLNAGKTGLGVDLFAIFCGGLIGLAVRRKKKEK